MQVSNEQIIDSKEKGQIDNWEYATDDVHSKTEDEIRRGVKQGWSMAKEGIPYTDHPLLAVAADAIGIERKESVQVQEELAQIIDLTVAVTGSNEPDEIYKFIRHQMRRGQTGNFGHTLKSLAQHLTELAQEFI